LGEHHENTLGTQWEQGRNTKNNCPHPTPKRKKQGPGCVHVEHKTFISKTVCHHFWRGLLVGAQISGHNIVSKYPFCFALARWHASQLQLFFCNEPIWLAYHSNKMMLWRVLKIECCILKCRIPPVWPTCIDEMRTNFLSKHME